MSKHPSRWGHLLSGLAGGVIAAMLVSAVFVTMTPAVGKTGDPMVLGTANRSGRATWLTSRGPSVMKLNNTGGNPVLDLRNGGGAAPLVVDSQKRVVNLNADHLDGRHALDLIRVASDATINAADGDGEAVKATITAPRAGYVVTSGSFRAGRVGADDYLACYLTVDGSVVDGTYRDLVATAGDPYKICSTTGVHPVDAGTYDIGLYVQERDTANLLDASVWALYVPFDGTGAAP